MLGNYFIIAWRNLYHDKFFTILNLVGLTLGIVCSIFIGMWIHDELSWDRFHTNINQLYRVYTNRPGNNGTFTQAVVPLAYRGRA